MMADRDYTKYNKPDPKEYDWEELKRRINDRTTWFPDPDKQKKPPE